MSAQTPPTITDLQFRVHPVGHALLCPCTAVGVYNMGSAPVSMHRESGLVSPAVFEDAFYFYLGCPLPGEGPDGHFPSKFDSVGQVSVRIRGVIFNFIFILTLSTPGVASRSSRFRQFVFQSRPPTAERGLNPTSY